MDKFKAVEFMRGARKKLSEKYAKMTKKEILDGHKRFKNIKWANDSKEAFLEAPFGQEPSELREDKTEWRKKRSK